MDLKNYFAILQRWGWIMLLCTALAGVTSYFYSLSLPQVFQARSRYLVGAVMDNPNVNTNDIRASSQIGQTYAEFVTSRPLLEAVIAKLSLDTDPGTLRRQVSATWIDTTQILSIRVQTNDAQLAADIANALGDVLIERSPNGSASQQTARRQAATTQLAQLQESARATQAEIDQLANQIQQTTDATVQRSLIVRMDGRRSQLAATQRAYSDLYGQLQTSNVNQISLVEPAVPDPFAPVAPDIQRNVLAALIAGLVLGLAAMMLLEYFTDVIHTPEMLRSVTGLTYLGGLPRHKKQRGSKGMQLVTVANPETLAAESFRILRTNLQLAGSDRQLSSVLITSPSRGDGKSDIAANLAVTFARAGKRVILIDANLRRPQIAPLFNISDQHGLSGLLDTNSAPELVPVPAIAGLSILPAGGTAANSSEILGSQQMYDLIQAYKARADVVLIDSPPLWYSDALALAPQVDGVLLAVSKDMTGRENTINAVESLRLVGARLIGTVFNRVKEGPAYFYYPTYVGDRPALSGPSLVDADRNRAMHALNSGSNSPSPAALASDAGVKVEDATGTAEATSTAISSEAQPSGDEPSLEVSDAASMGAAVTEPVTTFQSIDDADTNLASHTNGYRSQDSTQKNSTRPSRNKPHR
jgi:non-specific protein-tyrosine kinase